MPVESTSAEAAEADRQLAIFLGSIVIAVGITVASLVIAACRA